MAQHPLIQISHHNMIKKQEKHTTLYKVHTQAVLKDSNASTNLPIRGQTIQTSLLVVQLYRPFCL